MKPICVISLFLITFTNYAFAQSSPWIGIRNGISISKMKFDPWGDNFDFRKSMVSYSGGLQIEYLNHTYWSVVSNISYVQKGGIRINDTFSNRPTSERWELHYLSLDTQFKAKLPLHRFTPYVTIGPRVDYLTGYNHYFKEWNDVFTLAKRSYGIRYGIGVRYEVGRIGIFVDWLNNYNFNKVYDSKEYPNPALNRFTLSDQTMLLYLGTSLKI